MAPVDRSLSPLRPRGITLRPSALPSVLARSHFSSLGPLIAFLLLSAGFLWQPIVTGRVFLPTDLSYRYDYLWKPFEKNPDIQVSQNQVLSDVAYYYYPYTTFAIERLTQGHFPLWNPNIITGTPFFGSAQAAVLDPINLLTYLAGPLDYWTWGAWLRLALIGMGTFGFLRALGRSPAAGLAAGAIFMTCGFVAAWLNYNVVTSLSWMPVLFWATTRLLQTHRGVWLAATGLSMGGLFLGGHPETQFLIGLAWAFYCLYYMVAMGGTRPLGSIARLLGHRIVWLMGATLLGFGVGAAQVVAFMDFLLTTNAMTDRISAVDSFDPLESSLRLAVLFYPNFGGTPLRKNYWIAFTDFNAQTGYIGLLAVVLAVLGTIWWARRDRLVPFFAITAIVALLFALRAPVFDQIKALPLFNIGQGVRWLLIWSFCGAVLAGYGVDALLGMRARTGRLRNISFWFMSATLIAFGVLLMIYIGIRDPRWDESWNTIIPHVKMAQLFHPFRLTLYWPVIFLGLGAIVVLARWRGLLGARGAVSLLILLLYADLWSFGSRYNPTTPAAHIYPPLGIINYTSERLGHERMLGTGSVMVTNTSMLFKLRNLQGYEDVVEGRFAELYDPIMNGLLTFRFDRISSEKPELSFEEQRLIDLASVRYVLSSRQLLAEGVSDRYKPVYKEERVSVYYNEGALPRAYVVFNATVVPAPEAASATLLDRAFDPRRRVVLAEGSASLNDSNLDASAAPVTWLMDEPEQVELEATLPAPGYLVLSDNYNSGWEASVDGLPAPLLRANVAFRAVPVPAGKHKVTFAYRPLPVYVSGAVSLISVLIVLSLAINHLLMVRRRTSGRSD